MPSLYSTKWKVVLDTFTDSASPEEATWGGDSYEVQPCSMVVLQAWDEDSDER
jgi:hypothetical protein